MSVTAKNWMNDLGNGMAMAISSHKTMRWKKLKSEMTRDRGEMKNRLNEEGLKCRRKWHINMPVYLATRREVVRKI